MTVEPFRIHISDDVLADLRGRLLRSRLLADSPGRPASGMTNAYLRALIDSWIDFDWRAREDWLNTHPQFIATLSDARVHFVHLRSRKAGAPAIVVMHGWPHTFALQLDFARLLDDFDVVVPSLPGFVLSGDVGATFDEAEMARLMHRLMTDVLGYQSYLTYGEDVSANISDAVASQFPSHVAGIVATHAHFPSPDERAQLVEADETAFFERIRADADNDGGYAHEQATRPDTLSVGLNDSPAGLLAWIAEKLVEWSDTPPGDPSLVERRISRERILTEATLYWATQSISSSFRPYFDRRDADLEAVSVPAAVFVQRHERDYPESLARRFYSDLRVFERLPEGGHFTAAEVPVDLADRTRQFARDIGLLHETAAPSGTHPLNTEKENHDARHLRHGDFAQRLDR